MAQIDVLKAQIVRENSQSPWGFRLKGGAEYGEPISISRVSTSVVRLCNCEINNSSIDTLIIIIDLCCGAFLLCVLSAISQSFRILIRVVRQRNCGITIKR